jgi:hypothetical protein
MNLFAYEPTLNLLPFDGIANYCCEPSRAGSRRKLDACSIHVSVYVPFLCWLYPLKPYRSSRFWARVVRAIALVVRCDNSLTASLATIDFGQHRPVRA